MKILSKVKTKVGLLALGLIAVSQVSQSISQEQSPVVADTKPKPDARFDHTVREHFFSGFEGDATELAKGMKICEEVLAKEPKHAEAMVWLGGGQVFQSGQHFNKGRIAEGMKSWQEGIKNMDKASELEPDNIGVLIPRAAVLLPASRALPATMRTPVLEGVLKNFEHVYALQKDDLGKIGEHPLGELRMGLADIYRLLGKNEKSRENLESVIRELPDSEYATEAKKWLESEPKAKLVHNCIGCHSK